MPLDARAISRRWLPYRRPAPSARVRLLCLPPAGSAASFYRPWAQLAPPELDVCALQLPGRETRFGDPAIEDLPRLLSDLGEPVASLCDRPIAFLGYSFGSLLGYELARWMRARLRVEPVALIAVAFPPVHRLIGRAPGEPPRSREELVELQRSLGHTPAEVLANEELLELQLPAMAADFAILDRYRFQPATPLDCPVLALGGDADPKAPPQQMAGWAELTRGAFSQHTAPGGHFFALEQLEQTCARVFAHVLDAARQAR